MIRRLIAVGWFALVLFAGPAQTPAQVASPAPTVNEASARAVLGKDTIELRLPLNAPAPAGLRAAAWLLSPSNGRFAETSVDLREGSREAALELPWPTGATGQPVEQIGWYRIGYRIEAGGAPVAVGIMSIGAIASNLLDLRLANPAKVVSSDPLSVRIYAGNPVTRQPYHGVRLEARLAIDLDTSTKAKPATRIVVRSAVTNRSGEAIVTFPFPTEPGQTATLTVNGTMTSEGASVTASVSHDYEASDKTTIRVETDKPLHKPGETVHLRALVFNDAGRAAANTALTLTVNDPDSKKLIEAPLTTNRFGIAFYEWRTGPQLAPGDYNADFEIGDSSDYDGSGMSVIRIERYELPEFAVSATMDRGYYLEGQSPVVHIHAGYLFGKPVAAGSVRILRAGQGEWDPRTRKYKEADTAEQTATLDAKGDAELHLDVKSEFDDFKGKDYQRYIDVQYRAIVTDASTGRSEPRNFTVRLTRDSIHIYVDQLGGNDREGDYIVTASYADGAPAAAKVTFDWMDAEDRASLAATVTTSRYGLAKVHLRYPPRAPDDHQCKIRVMARDAEGRAGKLDDTVNPDAAQRIWISVAHTILKAGQPIEAVIHGAPGSIVDVDVLAETGQLAHEQVRMGHASEPLTVAAGAAFHGVVVLCAYAMNGDVPEYHYQWDGDAGYKAVLYPEDRELKVKLNGLRASYAPGARVDAALNVSNAAASPSALGIAVIDTAVEQRAETEEEANDRWFGRSWWEDESNAGGVTLEMLNRIDTSQPISGEIDLAAEKLLESPNVSGVHIDAKDDDEVRSDYLAAMLKDLKPLATAVLAARPQQLPASADQLRAIVETAKLDGALLIDPWNTPYRAHRTIEYTDEAVMLKSAGPDKRFGTADDFDVELVRRNFFALPGERLTKILTDAAIAGTALPGTLDGLKQMMRAGGLDLDATLDPEGKPYTYAIRVRRRFYSVQVSREDDTTVWTSPPIDYFSASETRMEAAIRAWTDSGKAFPDTVAGARQAFTAADIDFDALRDPLGKPFELHSIQLLAYTRFEKVKAGSTLDVKTKPVTHLLRAIQVMRAPDVEAGANEPADAEMVTQFLHPLTEQSGSDAQAQPVDQGTYKANTGAIGGTVTDQTGAIIAGATVEVKTIGGVPVASATTLANGSYVIPDLAPGLYSVTVRAGGFESFSLTEVHVSAVALTMIDVTLSVGAAMQTVTVEADVMSLQTDSNVVSSQVRVISGTAGKATVSEPTFTPRLRHVFEETAYWAPSLETSASGRASLHFTLPDSLTTWKLHALASTIDGRVGAIDQLFKTFQPFFVDLDAPQVLTVGDEIRLPVNLRNYTAHALALPATVKLADWFTLLTPATVGARVPANGAAPVNFGFRAASAVESGPLRITAANAHDGDAVEKTVRVHPDGEPRSAAASALLRTGSTTLALDLPDDAVPGSLHAELRLYPNLGTHLLHSMKAVLERPYGCGEQTISSTYPSLLFLELLKAAHATSPAQTQAQTYLQLGYDRLLGYFNAGGLTYWGSEDHEPDAALTAYGVEFLNEASPYISVDESRVVDAVSWLAAHQQADGSWKPHYGDANADLTLYIADVLHRVLAREDFTKAATRELRDRAATAVSRAEAWAATSVAAVHDPYANALRLRLARDEAARSRLRAELAQSAERDRSGTHWSSAAPSPFYGWGRAGDLETTALVLAALSRADASPSEKALESEALYYLLRSQDRYGIWWSGQATVRVLQALLPVAAEEMTAFGSTSEFQLTVNGAPLADADAQALHADRKLLEAPRTLDLTRLLHSGHNELVFTSASESALASVDAAMSYYTPWAKTAVPGEAKTQTGTEFGLDFGYRCAAENARVGQPIDCTVGLRRFGSRSYGMLLAEVGLPPGADVDRASLAKLLDDYTINRYELQPDRIVFYIWSWGAEGTHFSFRFTPRYAIRAKAAPATLSDYYNPDQTVTLAPQTFKVENK